MLSDSHQKKSNFLVETHSVDFVPHALRHGKVSDLLFVWFGANMELPVLTVGAVVLTTGFSLAWAIVALVVGALLGGLLMAYHSAQGPHLGLPQMIQSRAQFGYIGAAVPLIFAIALYIGFFAAGGVLVGQAFAVLFHLSVSWGIILGSFLSFVLALFGYNIIHRFEKYFSYFVAILFAAFTGILMFGHPFHHATHVTHGSFMLGPFLLAVAVAATSQLGYAVYVADYSRYLPEKTSISSAFWYTYAGVSVSGLWLMILGAVMQSHTSLNDPVRTIAMIAASMGPWFKVLTVIALILGLFSINAMNLYGGFMSSLTTVTTFIKPRAQGLTLRLWFLIPVGVVDTLMSFLYKSNLLNSYETFLVIILAFLIPWTAINLTDFYFVRRGRYETDALSDKNGEYGKFSGPGLISYAIGFLVQIPFMNNAIFDGPMAKALDNGDISWIVGALVASGLYFVLMKRQRASSPSVARLDSNKASQ